METLEQIICEAERICHTTRLNSPHQIIGCLAVLLEAEREKTMQLEQRLRWAERQEVGA